MTAAAATTRLVHRRPLLGSDGVGSLSTSVTVVRAQRIEVAEVPGLPGRVEIGAQLGDPAGTRCRVDRRQPLDQFAFVRHDRHPHSCAGSCVLVTAATPSTCSSCRAGWRPRGPADHRGSATPPPPAGSSGSCAIHASRSSFDAAATGWLADSWLSRRSWRADRRHWSINRLRPTAITHGTVNTDASPPRTRVEHGCEHVLTQVLGHFALSPTGPIQVAEQRTDRGVVERQELGADQLATVNPRHDDWSHTSTTSRNHRILRSRPKNLRSARPEATLSDRSPDLALRHGVRRTRRSRSERRIDGRARLVRLREPAVP